MQERYSAHTRLFPVATWHDKEETLTGVLLSTLLPLLQAAGQRCAQPAGPTSGAVWPLQAAAHAPVSMDTAETPKAAAPCAPWAASGRTGRCITAMTKTLGRKA
jgi:hypothetical protein